MKLKPKSIRFIFIFLSTNGTFIIISVMSTQSKLVFIKSRAVK